MKNLLKVLIITACVITGLTIAGCMKPLDYTELFEYGDKLKNKDKKITPSVKDFDISGIGPDCQYLLQQQLDVRIVSKEGSTQGEITIFCEDYKGDKYLISEVPPDKAGAYAVTFNAQETKYFNAAEDLYAGFLIINNPEYDFPQRSHFKIEGAGEYLYEAGKTRAVTVEPDAANPDKKSNGRITVNYYKDDIKIDGLPSAAGFYFVTFNIDVDDEGMFNAVYGIAAGTLIIKAIQTPIASDYSFTGLGKHIFGKDEYPVDIKPINTSKSTGAVTPYYEKQGSGSRVDSAPKAEGVYNVTFNVAAAEGFNAAAGLYAGTLTIFKLSGKDTPYTLTYLDGTLDELKNIINSNPGYYFELDLSNSGVISLEREFFKECDNLIEVTIPGSAIIGDNVFYSCRNLKSVTLLDGIETIGSWAFAGCAALESLIIPDSVTSIEETAFGGCFSLKEVIIPDSVTSIGKGAFGGCGGLESLIIGNGVTSIGEGAFGGCYSLKEVIIPDSVTSIGEGAFGGCAALESLIIGNGVITLKNWEFSGCSSLKEIIIGNSITSIEETAFSNACGNVESITIIGNGATIIGAFSGLYKLTSLTLSGVKIIGERAFNHCPKLTSLTIPNSVEIIGEGAFGHLGELTSLTIGNGVKTIGEGAFDYFPDLLIVTFEGTIPEANFHPDAFIYDNYSAVPGSGLRDVFYTTPNTSDGTPGIYEKIGINPHEWKQP